MTSEAVRTAIVEVAALIERVKTVNNSMKEMLHLESLKEPHFHAAASVQYNHTFNPKPEWSMAAGALMLSLSGLEGGHDDEFIVSILRKTLDVAKISGRMYDILKPLSDGDREIVMQTTAPIDMTEMSGLPPEKLH